MFVQVALARVLLLQEPFIFEAGNLPMLRTMLQRPTARGTAIPLLATRLSMIRSNSGSSSSRDRLRIPMILIAATDHPRSEDRLVPNSLEDCQCHHSCHLLRRSP